MCALIGSDRIAIEDCSTTPPPTCTCIQTHQTNEGRPTQSLTEGTWVIHDERRRRPWGRPRAQTARARVDGGLHTALRTHHRARLTTVLRGLALRPACVISRSAHTHTSSRQTPSNRTHTFMPARACACARNAHTNPGYGYHACRPRVHLTICSNKAHAQTARPPRRKPPRHGICAFKALP